MPLDKFLSPTVPCKICGNDTPMLGTKLCDRCWELEKRICMDPDLAFKILNYRLNKGTPERILIDTCTNIFGFEERGGGPEGIYYTHPALEGEFLFKQLGEAINLWIMHKIPGNQQ